MIVSPALLIAVIAILVVLIISNDYDRRMQIPLGHREQMIVDNPRIRDVGLRPSVHHDGWTIYWSENPFAMNRDKARSLTSVILTTGIKVEKDEVDKMLAIECRPEIVAMIKIWPVRVR